MNYVELYGALTWAVNDSLNRYADIIRNGVGGLGSVRVKANESSEMQVGTGPIPAVPGDTYVLRVYQNSGITLNLVGATFAIKVLG